MAKGFTERATVQDPLVKYASEVGWVTVSQAAQLSLRKGEAGLFFYQVLRDKLIEFNPDVVTESNVDEVIRRMESARASIEGNEDVLLWLRGQRSVYVDRERREMNVKVIDYDYSEHNVFQVTDEWDYTNGRFRNRADVVFLINGVPVALIETKAANKPDGIDQGITQIRRYHRETPEMLTAPQVFDTTHLISFYYGVTWSLDRRNLFNWKDEAPGNFEQKVKRFFDRERFLKVLRDYIAFIHKDDELSKIILRQHQTRAVEKVVGRVADQEKRRGLIWHTQGSGKTLTMITVAHQLLTRPEFEKPTVLMLVDRNELESQLFRNLEGYGISDVEVAGSKKDLQQLLKSGYRGLIVSMIHKFDRVPKDINTSEQVVVLVDEAHRTTGGDLGNYLMAALPNATYVGFTGTPIDRTAYGRGTFKVFGTEDAEGYLDKYSIAESIEDGTTLPLHYSLAPNEIQVPREQLEREFLDLAEAEGVSDIEDLNRILDRAVTLKAFLKSKDRIDRVAKFVAQHYRSNVEPLGYKAFLVGVDREACALYKDALDKYLPEDYSRVVYTEAHNDPAGIKRYYMTEDEEKKLRKAFLKPGTLPKILIVTEKLLTGFDAPILYSMYLDKPMRDHALLQAIARVNRPYEEEGEVTKPSGFVLDFVGIFDKLEKALAFDSDVVSGVIENLDVLKDRFATLMAEEADPYLALARGKIDDKAVERIIDTFTDKEAREEFSNFFKEIETLYEIISPDPFLGDYIERYQQLTAIFAIVRAAFGVKGSPIKDLMRKTEDLVRQHVTAGGLEEVLPVYQINDETLEALKKDTGSDSAKVVNLARSLASAVKDQEEEQPHLIPIGDRAARVLELFEDRQLDTVQALRELEKAIEEFNAARREMQERGFDIETFSIYWVLRRSGFDESAGVSVAPGIQRAFGRLGSYRQNAEQRRELTAELYRLLLPHTKRASRAREVVEEILRVRRK
jgi:type I restriction enzyme R subunit